MLSLSKQAFDNLSRLLSTGLRLTAVCHVEPVETFLCKWIFLTLQPQGIYYNYAIRKFTQIIICFEPKKISKRAKAKFGCSIKCKRHYAHQCGWYHAIPPE